MTTFIAWCIIIFLLVGAVPCRPGAASASRGRAESGRRGAGKSSGIFPVAARRPVDFPAT